SRHTEVARRASCPILTLPPRHARMGTAFQGASMPIWTQTRSVAELNTLLKGTMGEHVGVEILEIGDDYLSARLPVDGRTQQPMGILHGGASVVLAETIGSIASGMCCPPGHFIVGL